MKEQIIRGYRKSRAESMLPKDQPKKWVMGFNDTIHGVDEDSIMESYGIYGEVYMQGHREATALLDSLKGVVEAYPL